MEETFDLYPVVKYDMDTMIVLGFLYSGVMLYMICLYKCVRPPILPLFER